MDHIGIDVHKRASQVCIRTEEGELLERRIGTRRDTFAELLGERPRARILIEAATESEWVARCLEELGHEVIVADPNFAPMYAQRTRRVKTDRRDARALCEACRLGAYRPAHRMSEGARERRAQVAVREALVNTRTKYIVLIRSLVRQQGLRIPSGSSASFTERLSGVALPESLAQQVQPLLEVMASLNAQIKASDRLLATHVKHDEVAGLLCTVPGVGPVTAVTFAAVIDDVRRFRSAAQVRAYLGLVPREMSSGEKQHRGRITKAGNRRLRSLLVEAAWAILRYRNDTTETLREWALRIATRRGKRVAAVALARKLAGVLYAMWRDGTAFQAQGAAVESMAA
jgi:transposase